MGWVFNGLEEEDYAREYSDIELFKRIFKYLTPYKFGFFLMAIMVVISTILNLLSPLVLGFVINSYNSQSLPETLLLLFAATYLLMSLFLFISYFLGQWGNIILIPDFMVNLRLRVFRSLQNQDMKFYDKKQSGRLSSRVGGDAAEVGNIIGILAVFSGNFLLIFLSYAILFLISLELALITLLVLPLVVLSTIGFRRLARRMNRKFRVSVASINASISESVEGIKVAKAYGREKEVLNRFSEVNQNNYSIGKKFTLTMELLMPTVNIFFILSIWLVIIFGSNLVLNTGSISPGDLYIFILYLNTFFFPLMQLSSFGGQISAGLGSFERILEVIDHKPDVDENKGGKIIEKVDGKIEFRNVDFSYNDGEPILKNFNLIIKPGEKLAIVGATGAGKTTITNLICRFYEFQKGKILIDDHDIRDLDLKEYRKHLGIVQQDPFLFSGTVEENIKYGRWDASEGETNKAIEAVRAKEFIDYMPEGLKTDVHERGSRLSTGQRQLVCFARAILANPEILILDEATSSVDAYTESVIQEALEVLFEGRTSIIVAHRLSTVQNADRIIVLDQGTIIEDGNHKSLIEKSGKYKELYDYYFKHQAIDWSPEELSITEVATKTQ